MAKNKNKISSQGFTLLLSLLALLLVLFLINSQTGIFNIGSRAGNRQIFTRVPLPTAKSTSLPTLTPKKVPNTPQIPPNYR